MNKIAFLFPGQGSQSIGMLSDLIKGQSIIYDALNEASSIVNFDIIDLITNGPKETLNLTVNAQPVILALSVALWRYWCSKNTIRPTILAGHSLGEYSALVCAEVINFKDALLLVKKRGELMQNAVPENTGAMAAVIGMPDQKVNEVCNSITINNEGILVAANFNAPGQVVIAGEKTLIEKSIEVFNKQGARKIIMLPVSVPSHCILMKPAADNLTQYLNKVSFNAPKISLVQNVTAKIENDPQIIRENLIQQLCLPVRWMESIKLIAQSGIDLFYECGPNKVLTGLNKRILKEAKTLSLESVCIH